MTSVCTSTTIPSQHDVLDALLAWNPDVTTVNNSLNNALNDGADLSGLAQGALNSAMNGPIQLGFLACKPPHV